MKKMWKKQTKLSKQQQKRLEKATENLQIAIYEALIPAIEKAVINIKAKQEDTSGK